MFVMKNAAKSACYKDHVQPGWHPLGKKLHRKCALVVEEKTTSVN